MRMIVFTLLAVLLVGGAVAQRYVPYPYNSMQDFFSDKYGGLLQRREASLPPTPSYIDPKTGQLFVFRPYAPGIPVTEKSYYRMNNAQLSMQIDAGSFDDGYNYGYYKGYQDGIAIRPLGYEAYFDYVETHKPRTDLRQGYYQLPDKQVQITVSESDNPYNNGYAAGILQGFKDAYYDVKYNGLNQEYYAYQAVLEKYPGQYQAVPAPIRARNAYRTFPAYGYYYGGMRFYGFNYQ